MQHASHLGSEAEWKVYRGTPQEVFAEELPLLLNKNKGQWALYTARGLVRVGTQEVLETLAATMAKNGTPCYVGLIEARSIADAPGTETTPFTTIRGALANIKKLFWRA